MLGGLRAWFEYHLDEAVPAVRPRAETTTRPRANSHDIVPWRCCARGTSRRQSQDSAALPNSIPCPQATAHGWLIFITSRVTIASAAEDLERSFDLDRDYPEARLYQGLLRYRQENYRGVVECLSESDSRWISACSQRLTLEKVSESLAWECVERLDRSGSPAIREPAGGSFRCDRNGTFRSCL